MSCNPVFSFESPLVLLIFLKAADSLCLLEKVSAEGEAT